MEVKLVVLEFVMMVGVLRPWGRAGSGIGQKKFQKARTSWPIALGIIRAKGGKVVAPANEGLARPNGRASKHDQMFIELNSLDLNVSTSSEVEAGETADHA